MMKSQFLFLILLLPILGFSQAWDYVEITPGAGRDITNACIDEADNVYTIGRDNVDIRKFNASGALEWEKDASSLLFSGVSLGLGGIAYHDSNIYTVGANPASSNGMIVQSGVTLGDIPVAWDEMSCSPATSNCTVNDIKIEGEFMYVVGVFGLSDITTTLSFFDGTTLSASRRSTFIAKYSISPKTLVWAKAITSSESIRGESLDIDDLGNIFVGGVFRGSSVFYDGITPYIFTSSNMTFSDGFLSKFDADGNFNSTFNLKTRDSFSGSRYSYDVDVSNENAAVYWSETNNVLAFEKDGSGNALWLKNILFSKVFSIETNRCGDVYITGTKRNGSRTICGDDYFAQLLDNSDGSTVWESTATACTSYGSEVMIDSNNKEIITGSYFSTGTSETLVVDDTYFSTSTNGYFIGRYDDEPVNSCCKNPAHIDLPSVIKMCDSSYEELCGPLSTWGGPIYTYEWWGPDAELGESVVLSTSRCFTPNIPGEYVLVVTDENGCVTTHHISIVFYSPFIPELDDITYCPEEVVLITVGWFSDPFADFPCKPDYQWTHNGTVIEGATSYNAPAMGPGTYCVQLIFEFFSVTRCFEVVECCDPMVEFSVAWTYNIDGSFTITVDNVSTSWYDSETYYLEKDCNHDGIPGPWEFVDAVTRTDDYDESISFEGLDPNCLYRITHRVSSACRMKSFIHTEYVGGNPGIAGRNWAIGNTENQGQNTMNISPNPTNGMITLSMNNVEAVYQFNVYTLQGQLVKTIESSDRSTEMDLSDLDSGIYLIKATNGIDSFTKRVVKM